MGCIANRQQVSRDVSEVALENHNNIDITVSFSEQLGSPAGKVAKQLSFCDFQHQNGMHYYAIYNGIGGQGAQLSRVFNTYFWEYLDNHYRNPEQQIGVQAINWANQAAQESHLDNTNVLTGIGVHIAQNQWFQLVFYGTGKAMSVDDQKNIVQYHSTDKHIQKYNQSRNSYVREYYEGPRQALSSNMEYLILGSNAFWEHLGIDTILQALNSYTPDIAEILVKECRQNAVGKTSEIGCLIINLSIQPD